MKQILSEPNSFVLRAVAAAVTAALLTFATLPATAANGSDEVRVEARIKNMHDQLKITPAEEAQWTSVASVMRDNAKSMDQRASARAANAKTMTAVEDLNSYSDITAAHADEVKKFAGAFTTLYAALSDAQKTEADTLFRQGDRHKSMHKK